jgi:hypothetical protein
LPKHLNDTFAKPDRPSIPCRRVCGGAKLFDRADTLAGRSENSHSGTWLGIGKLNQVHCGSIVHLRRVGMSASIGHPLHVEKLFRSHRAGQGGTANRAGLKKY